MADMVDKLSRYKEELEQFFPVKWYGSLKAPKSIDDQEALLNYTSVNHDADFHSHFHTITLTLFISNINNFSETIMNLGYNKNSETLYDTNLNGVTSYSKKVIIVG